MVSADHALDHKERKSIAAVEAAQIQKVSDKVDTVANDLRDHIAENHAQFKKLAPLTDSNIIVTLERIVKREDGNQIIAERWGHWLRIVSTYALIAVSVAGFMWYVIAIALGFKGSNH